MLGLIYYAKMFYIHIHTAIQKFSDVSLKKSIMLIKAAFTLLKIK